MTRRCQELYLNQSPYTYRVVKHIEFKTNYCWVKRSQPCKETGYLSSYERVRVFVASRYSVLLRNSDNFVGESNDGVELLVRLIQSQFKLVMRVVEALEKLAKTCISISSSFPFPEQSFSYRPFSPVNLITSLLAIFPAEFHSVLKTEHFKLSAPGCAPSHDHHCHQQLPPQHHVAFSLASGFWPNVKTPEQKFANNMALVDLTWSSTSS